jgi:uncharacterized phiE125 gp8 family phage protein
MLSLAPLVLDSIMLDEVRAFLRVDDDIDDSSLAASLLAALGYAEQFTRQILLRRTATETVTSGGGWQILKTLPVQSVMSVTAIPAEGATYLMPAEAWEAKISSTGEVYFRVLQPGNAGRAAVACNAGLVADWANVPEALRMGILRLAGYFFAHRDGAEDSGPPAAALALLRPWRRVQVA